MITGHHPLFTDGDTHSQVLSHYHKWLLKNVKTTKLPLHISPQSSTLYIYTQKQTQKERRTKLPLTEASTYMYAYIDVNKN